MLKVYNTLSKEKEEFHPQIEGLVKMYVCGVTVYDFCHIGHARAYVVFDVIRRYLRYKGYKVTYVQNFTDVDDKIIKRAAEKGILPLDLSKAMIAEYFTDMERLNIALADSYPKVSEHMEQIISFIEELIAKGYAYVVKGDVYFEVRKFKEYGRLSKRNIEDMQAGVRIEVNQDKRDSLDFSLWKSAKLNEENVSWDSPWGKGRPGWHIECSAMSKEYLGETFDIHGGGHDLIFPHHENEIAQSEALSRNPMAKYWVHNGFVKTNKEKMSKSLGNYFTVRDVLKDNEPMALRLLFLMTHYRAPINYSIEEIKETKVAYDKICKALNIKHVAESTVPEMKIAAYRQQFQDAMDDDFNTAKAVALVFNIVHALNKSQDKKLSDLLQEFVAVLGITTQVSEQVIPEEVETLAKERLEAKNSKNWALSDELREKINDCGYQIEDRKDGYTLKKI